MAAITAETAAPGAGPCRLHAQLETGEMEQAKHKPPLPAGGQLVERSILHWEVWGVTSELSGRMAYSEHV